MAFKSNRSIVATIHYALTFAVTYGSTDSHFKRGVKKKREVWTVTNRADGAIKSTALLAFIFHSKLCRSLSISTGFLRRVGESRKTKVKGRTIVLGVRQAQFDRIDTFDNAADQKIGYQEEIRVK